jgi:ribonuclease T2
MAIWLVVSLLLGVATPAYSQDSPAHPGNFDHYLLALSWSPEFCYSHPSDPQCSAGRHLGFVVHGLWPESGHGRGQEYCQTGAERLPISRELLEVMPDPGLIRHEWAAHGSCTALSPDEYFALIRRAFFSIRIPREFIAPRAPFNISPDGIKRAFERENPGLSGSDIGIECREHYLSGVEICMTKDLHPMPCPAMRDCYARSLRVTPIR